MLEQLVEGGGDRCVTLLFPARKLMLGVGAEVRGLRFAKVARVDDGQNVAAAHGMSQERLDGDDATRRRGGHSDDARSVELHLAGHAEGLDGRAALDLACGQQAPGHGGLHLHDAGLVPAVVAAQDRQAVLALPLLDSGQAGVVCAVSCFERGPAAGVARLTLRLRHVVLRTPVALRLELGHERWAARCARRFGDAVFVAPVGWVIVALVSVVVSCVVVALVAIVLAVCGMAVAVVLAMGGHRGAGEPDAQAARGPQEHAHDRDEDEERHACVVQRAPELSHGQVS
jgi:hypothetical protein